jgi:hypothetical protein
MRPAMGPTDLSRASRSAPTPTLSTMMILSRTIDLQTSKQPSLLCLSLLCLTLSFFVFVYSEPEDEDARTRKIIKSNHFTQQTNTLDVDKHMYVSHFHQYTQDVEKLKGNV